MGKIKAIIVDDERGARDVLTNILKRHCTNVEVISQCSNLINAAEDIKNLQPDVVFLDIEMPNYAGYEIVSFFDDINFEIIFVTAYDKYAIKAFEVSAVDYLLKPIDIDRLIDALEKLETKLQSKSIVENYASLSSTLKNKKISNIFISENGYQQSIELSSIIAIQAQESYSLIHTETNNYIVSKNLKHFENVLDEEPSFFRCHKSWIINKNKVIKFSKSKLEIELEKNIKAKLSKYRKPEFEDFLTN